MITQWILLYLSAIALSVAFAGIIIPKILLIAFRKELFDKPDGRKIHHGAVPRLGGFAFTPVIIFVMAFLIGVCVASKSDMSVGLLNFDITTVCLALCGLIMMYLIGMADDLIGVRYRSKFLFEFIVSVFLICGGLDIVNFEGVFWIHHVPRWIGYPLTIVLVIFVTNAINLIDGIDGLASGLSGIAFAIYGSVCILLGEPFYATLSFAVLGVLIPFFYYNVFGSASEQKKIFMGDTGSLTIGLLLSFIGLKIWHMSDTDTVGIMPNYFIVMVSPLLIPCFDVVRVFLLRIRLHHDPFMPDKNHIHHKLLNMGMPQRLAMITIVSASFALCIVNTALSFYLHVNIIVLLDIAFLILWNVWINHRVERHHAALEAAKKSS